MAPNIDGTDGEQIIFQELRKTFNTVGYRVHNKQKPNKNQFKKMHNCILASHVQLVA